jgi:hypothetical protein
VRAGQLGARRRWGEEPRIARLDDLTPPQRRLVQALISAQRAENAKAAADVDPATAAPAEGTRNAVQPTR